jgi:hypothetical protein
MSGGVTPACNTCGVYLCWDLADEEYAEDAAFWEAWICESCNGGTPMSLRAWREKRAIKPATLGDANSRIPKTVGAPNLKIKPHSDGNRVKPDIILANGRRLRHLPGPDVRQYRMSGIRALPGGRFAVIGLDFYMHVESGPVDEFPTLAAAIAWADYLADDFSAAWGESPKPDKPAQLPQRLIDLANMQKREAASAKKRHRNEWRSDGSEIIITVS